MPLLAVTFSSLNTSESHSLLVFRRHASSYQQICQIYSALPVVGTSIGSERVTRNFVNVCVSYVQVLRNVDASHIDSLYGGKERVPGVFVLLEHQGRGCSHANVLVHQMHGPVKTAKL